MKLKLGKDANKKVLYTKGLIYKTNSDSIIEHILSRYLFRIYQRFELIIIVIVLFLSFIYLITRFEYPSLV